MAVTPLKPIPLPGGRTQEDAVCPAVGQKIETDRQIQFGYRALSRFMSVRNEVRFRQRFKSRERV